MADSVVNVKIKEDNSVKKAIEDTAKRLQGKYSKKRKVNEKLLYKKSKWLNALTIVLNVLCIIVVFCSAVVFFSIVNCKAQGVAPSFGGYTSMRIASSSMEASGFKKGDTVMARRVDTKTLKKGDVIAYYKYNEITVDEGKAFDDLTAESANYVTKYSLSFGGFFGAQSDEIKKAARDNSLIFFHEIVEVREDADGTRWFKTWGTSNLGDMADPENPGETIPNPDDHLEDNWYVSEDMVIGIYDNSGTANFFAGVIGAFSSSSAIVLLLLIPLVIIGVIIILEFLKDIQIYKLQLDVIEEKRKITDPICVKHEIGFKMDNKSKYKVLAQANDEDKNEYISLLWRDGTVPRSIKKYCLRKKMYLKPVERLLEVNRECEARLKKGEDPLLVAEYYTKEKEKLQKEQLEYERQFRSWMKEDKQDIKQMKQDAKLEKKAAASEARVASSQAQTNATSEGAQEVKAEEPKQTSTTTSADSKKVSQAKASSAAKPATAKPATSKTTAAKSSTKSTSQKSTTKTDKK